MDWKPRKLDYEEAVRVQNEWIGRLRPYTHRIEPSGSIRRGEYRNGDVDLVLIRDDSRLGEFTAELLRNSEYLHGQPDGKVCRRALRGGAMLDLRMCSEEDFGWRQFVQTGNTALTVWAREFLEATGSDKKFPEESDVFEALEIGWLEPQERSRYGMDKIIFLNIDGVLDPHEPGRLRQVRPEKLELLHTLIKQTGAGVVVTGADRLHHDTEGLRELLQTTSVIGATTETPTGVRGIEIDNYREEHQPSSFVVLDSSADRWMANERLILTQQHEGLTEQQTETAVEILNGQQ